MFYNFNLFGSLVVYGASKLDIVTLDEVVEPKEYFIDMNDNLYLGYFYNIEYIPEERDNIRIVYFDSEFSKLNIETYENGLVFHTERDYNEMKYLGNIIDNLNKLRIVDENFLILVYASSENIQKLKNNHNSSY